MRRGDGRHGPRAAHPPDRPPVSGGPPPTTPENNAGHRLLFAGARGEGTPVRTQAWLGYVGGGRRGDERDSLYEAACLLSLLVSIHFFNQMEMELVVQAAPRE